MRVVCAQLIECVIDAGRLVNVTTSLRSYTNMACTSLKPTRDKNTGDVLAFSASFKVVRVVTNLIEKPTADLRGRGQSKLGKQAAAPTAPEVEKPYESLLFQGADALTGGGFGR